MFTAREIVRRLHENGYLDATWGNTGGGVYNVVFEPVCQHGTVLGSVNVSDNGDWGSGDIDVPAWSVTVGAYAPNGDPLGDDYGVARDVHGVLDMVEELCVRLEDKCAECRADREGEETPPCRADR